jgi:hypothetical protein
MKEPLFTNARNIKNTLDRHECGKQTDYSELEF